MTARHLKLKQLFPKADSMRASIGEVNGSAKLSGTGNSVAALMGSSNGEAKLLVENGTVSKFILEAIGLNVGSVVVSKLFGDKPVQINCGVSDFAVKDGIARARTFVLDTQDAVITTDGAIDFGEERLALTIHPDSKGLRIISLRSPLYVGGTFKNPSVSPNIAVLALRAGGALALALTAPVALVVPLLDISPGGDESQCARLLAELKKRPTAPPPGKTYQDPATGAPASRPPARRFPSRHRSRPPPRASRARRPPSRASPRHRSSRSRCSRPTTRSFIRAARRAARRLTSSFDEIRNIRSVSIRRQVLRICTSPHAAIVSGPGTAA